MKNRVLWCLVVLNVLLGVGLAVRMTGDNNAVAQVRRPADYILIPGEVSGGSSAVVYMVDTSNGFLGAMAYDDASKVLNVMPPIDLARVFETGPNAPGGARPGAAGRGGAAGGASGAAR